jgi:hypothetical protein
VKPEIAAVLGRRDQLLFTPETAQQLREQGEAGLADAVEQAVRDGARPPGRPQQLYLLSTPDDERTKPTSTGSSNTPAASYAHGSEPADLVERHEVDAREYHISSVDARPPWRKRAAARARAGLARAAADSRG